MKTNGKNRVTSKPDPDGCIASAGCLIIVAVVLLKLALLGVIIWGIVELVNHFTS